MCEVTRRRLDPEPTRRSALVSETRLGRRFPGPSPVRFRLWARKSVVRAMTGSSGTALGSLPSLTPSSLLSVGVSQCTILVLPLLVVLINRRKIITQPTLVLLLLFTSVPVCLMVCGVLTQIPR